MGLYKANEVNANLSDRSQNKRKTSRKITDPNLYRPDTVEQLEDSEVGDKPARRKRIVDMSLTEQVDAAKDTILNILTYMPRTQHEIQLKLEKKGYSAIAIDQAISRMVEVGVINDASFAEQWAQSRFNSAGKSPYAIKMELERKGVDKSAIESALEPFQDAEVQRARALELAETKANALTRKGNQLGPSDVQKIAALLARKGFPAGICFDVAKEVVSNSNNTFDPYEETL